MNESITNVQIKRAVPRSACIAYKQLGRIRNLDSKLARTPFIFVLYEFEKNYGHWCLIFRQNDRVEFFDPYGSKPDSALKNFPKNIRSRFGLDYPQVARLLYGSRFPIEYNNHKLQSHDQRIQTCGKWCIMRALMHDIHIDQFARLWAGPNKDYRLNKAFKSVF